MWIDVLCVHTGKKRRNSTISAYGVWQIPKKFKVILSTARKPHLHIITVCAFIVCLLQHEHRHIASVHRNTVNWKTKSHQPLKPICKKCIFSCCPNLTSTNCMVTSAPMHTCVCILKIVTTTSVWQLYCKGSITNAHQELSNCLDGWLSWGKSYFSSPDPDLDLTQCFRPT